MAKDDYHVIVYKILAYLYMQLKAGEKVNPEMIQAKGKLFDIPEAYWQFIISSLFNEGYIDGATIEPWGKGKILVLDECRITVKGIEYLCDNSLLNKAKESLKDVKDITSFI